MTQVQLAICTIVVYIAFASFGYFAGKMFGLLDKTSDYYKYSQITYASFLLVCAIISVLAYKNFMILCE